MRKTIISSAAALALGFAAATGPANAQIEAGSDLLATVDFDKTVTLTENLTITKTVFVNVSHVFEFGRAAESIMVSYQSTTDLNVDTNYPGGSDAIIAALDLDPLPGPGDLGDIPVHHQLTVAIRDSMTGNSGIVQFNQDGGNGNNQGNTFSAAVAFNAAFAESNSSAQQTTSNNTLNSQTPGWATARYATIVNSANNNSGLLMVNQSVGHGGNQLNGVSIAIGRDGATVALSEADLGQFNTLNTVNDSNSLRRGNIVTSFNGNQGIALGNQSTGNFNNQATVISIAGAVH